MTAAGQIKKRARFNSGTLAHAAKQLAISAGSARATVEPTLTPAALGELYHAYEYVGHTGNRVAQRA